MKLGAQSSGENTEMIRIMLTKLEHKQDEDIAQRMKDIESLKAQFEQKLINMVEKIKMDEK
jgi:hypothetical protein